MITEILAATPWYLNPGLMGAILGPLVGLHGALLGTLAGVFAPRGQLRGVVMTLAWGLPILGVLLLAVGGAVLLSGHQWMTAYPYLLTGFIATVVGGSLLPVPRMVYAAAERRRMEAGDL